MNVVGTKAQIRPDQASARKLDAPTTPEAIKDADPAASVQISQAARRAALTLQDRPVRQILPGTWHSPGRLIPHPIIGAGSIATTSRPLTGASVEASTFESRPYPTLMPTDPTGQGSLDAQPPVESPIILTLPGDKPSSTASRV